MNTPLVLALIGLLLFGYSLSGHKSGSTTFWIALLAGIAIITSIVLWTQ